MAWTIANMTFPINPAKDFDRTMENSPVSRPYQYNMLLKSKAVDMAFWLKMQEHLAIMQDPHLLGLLDHYEQSKQGGHQRKHYRLKINARIKALMWLSNQIDALWDEQEIDEDGDIVV